MKIWEELVPDEANAFKESIPLSRIGDCEKDIGKAVVSLVGPNMRYITGATIPIDGGHSHLR
jgi:NAD(P)-dependent dehydrogenase (short-subunit alcohol dehydrogenase family)